MTEGWDLASALLPSTNVDTATKNTACKALASHLHLEAGRKDAHKGSFMLIVPNGLECPVGLAPAPSALRPFSFDRQIGGLTGSQSRWDFLGPL